MKPRRFLPLLITLAGSVTMVASASAQTAPPAAPVPAAPAPMQTAPAASTPPGVAAAPQLPPPPPAVIQAQPTPSQPPVPAGPQPMRQMPPPPPSFAPVSPAMLNTPGPKANVPSNMVIPGVAAVVDGVKITNQEFVTEFLKSGANDFMNQEIIYVLIHQAAAKQHIVATPAEVTARLQEIKTKVLPQYPGLTWAQFLYQQGRSEYAVRENLESRILVEKLVAKAQAPQSLAGKVHLYHILKLTVTVPGGGKPLADADAKAQIEQIAEDINAGKISFTEAAAKYSDDVSTKIHGGDLGWQGPDAPLDQSFKTAAFALKENAISGPVHSQFGWHLIYAAKFGVHATPADIAANAASQQNQQSQQAIPAYVQQLRTEAKVVNNLFPAIAMPPHLAGGPMQQR